MNNGLIMQILYWTGALTWLMIGGCAISQIVFGLTYRILKTFGYTHEMCVAYWRSKK